MAEIRNPNLQSPGGDSGGSGGDMRGMMAVMLLVLIVVFGFDYFRPKPARRAEPEPAAKPAAAEYSGSRSRPAGDGLRTG